jgi:predicted enzyme involved in methoxymalonyl-ACP biosynthesis
LDRGSCVGPEDDGRGSFSSELSGRSWVGRPRIAQLVGRSNQFNLTTRRYTSAQILELERDPAVLTLQIRLADRFGDNGMISVVIVRLDGAVGKIDTWLMSCRVLGRRVEEAVLAEVAERASDAGADRLLGRWIPSGRNSLVEDHFAKLGFAPQGTDGDDTLWVLDLGGYTPPDLPIRVSAAGSATDRGSPGP